MRCCSRSTTSPGSAAALLAVVLVVAVPGPRAVADEPVEDAARAAIEQAVKARFDGDAVVHVSGLRVTNARPAHGRVIATLDPGVRLGRPTRFALRSTGGGFAGEAACTVRVETEHARARRDLPRGHVLTTDDITIVRGDVGTAPLKALPRELVGARTTRDVAAGSVLAGPILVVPPLVRSGETVTTVVRMPGMEVRGRATASQNGDLGELIRVVNPESRRALRARVVWRGQVEVIHWS